MLTNKKGLKVLRKSLEFILSTLVGTAQVHRTWLISNYLCGSIMKVPNLDNLSQLKVCSGVIRTQIYSVQNRLSQPLCLVGSR